VEVKKVEPIQYDFPVSYGTWGVPSPWEYGRRERRAAPSLRVDPLSATHPKLNPPRTTVTTSSSLPSLSLSKKNRRKEKKEKEKT
jgi:hypothetical protein